MPDCDLKQTLNGNLTKKLLNFFFNFKFKGHNCNASSVTFHPQSTITQEKSALNLVSAGFDGTIRLWNLER